MISKEFEELKHDKLSVIIGNFQVFFEAKNSFGNVKDLRFVMKASTL